MTKNRKHKHLSFDDRCVIHQFLDFGHSFSKIANRTHKDRTTISKEIRKHRFSKDNSKKPKCSLLSKPPYVCNHCEAHPHCSNRRFFYDAAVAQNEYVRQLSLTRSVLKVTKEQVDAINEVIAPLMIHKHHSVNHVYAAHPDILPISKSTFYRYIDRGILDVKNIDLQRKVRYRVKKQYSYPTREKISSELKFGRFYHDFQAYLELHPLASIVEMDTVIGTQGGKGGKCMLTLLLRQFNFMLIYLLPYRKKIYVTRVFSELKSILGDEEFSRIFEVILTDNGSEFSDPVSIEVSIETGELLSNLFYCEPNCSWQKGSLERNHQYIRYVLPKGTSFSGLTQDDCNLLASHINSVPRASLNNRSPFEAALGFLGTDNILKLGIVKVPNDEIDLSVRLFEK